MKHATTKPKDIAIIISHAVSKFSDQHGRDLASWVMTYGSIYFSPYLASSLLGSAPRVHMHCAARDDKSIF